MREVRVKYGKRIIFTDELPEYKDIEYIDEDEEYKKEFVEDMKDSIWGILSSFDYNEIFVYVDERISESDCVILAMNVMSQIFDENFEDINNEWDRFCIDVSRVYQYVTKNIMRHDQHL